uniref:Uncharacterized protein n=1 Tax=Molossus molossus TaxID=27622 RepID=A0A7J8I9J6_MOLMO|nr:hypothetical protein HJG59_013447 [Molossus molossus]
MCFAASAAGNASTLGKILVQGEPGRETGCWAPEPHPLQQPPRGCRHLDGAGGVLWTSDPGLGSHWWYKNGALLTPGNKYQTLSEPCSGLLMLEIRETSKEDLGYYECELVNQLGSIRGGVELCLQDPTLQAGEQRHRREHIAMVEVTEQETKVPKKTIIMFMEVATFTPEGVYPFSLRSEERQLPGTASPHYQGHTAQ